MTSTPPPSPYESLAFSDWKSKTSELVEAHPLGEDELVEVVIGVWESIFTSSIGSYVIGRDLFPTPQIMAFLIHELVPLELQHRHPGLWRGQKDSTEKDLVYIPDKLYSVEIKASSSNRRIFGNRSYAQKPSRSRKSKSGYYLAVNFQKFSVSPEPKITLIRFGWLDHEDWTGQVAPTGQQSSLARHVEGTKLQMLYESHVVE